MNPQSSRRAAIKAIAFAWIPWAASCGGGGAGDPPDRIALEPDSPDVGNATDGPWIRDAYIGPDGTLLESRAAEVGGRPAKHPMHPAEMEIRGNAARISQAAQAHYLYPEPDGLGAAQDIAFSLRVDSHSGNLGVTARADPEQDSYLWLRYDSTAGAWQLRRCIDGRLSTLGSFEQALDPGQTYRVNWTLRGASSAVLIDGVERITAVDDRWLERGQVGLRGRGSASGGGYAIANLVVRPVAGLRSCWSGACTDTTAVVALGVAGATPPLRLVVSGNEDLSGATVSPAIAPASGAQAVKVEITGLQAATKYYYAVESVDGSRVLRLAHGAFRTLPQPARAASFMFAHASCARTGSNQLVFDSIRRRDPLFFVHQGDLHYEDITVNDVDVYRAAYREVLDSPRQNALFAQVPVLYRYGDHDSCGENSSRMSPNWSAAQQAYREQVPHHPLAQPDAVYQAFTVGRVRFILLDMYSWRDPFEQPLTPGKSALGSAQKAWLKRELAEAVPVHGARLVIIDVCNPWIGDETTNSDRWGAYPAERQEIHDHIRASGLVGKVVLIAGDMHAVAYDDGTNSDYASGGGVPIVVYQAAPLDRDPTVKGGPYSSGTPIQNNGQYGVLTVTDEGGDTLAWRWSAYWVDPDANAEVRILSHEGRTSP